MRLIDADALLENNPDFADRDFIHPMYDTTLRDIVDDAPTIDAVPVVHGEWVRVENDDSYHYECSRCGERPLYSKYGDVVLSGTCPMCGARMDGGER